MLLNKDVHEYPTLKRVTAKSGQRQYTGDDNHPVPSVTTILSATGDKSALIAWRKRVGDAEATRISTEAAGLGTKVHNALEKHILGEEWNTFGNNHVCLSFISQYFEWIEDYFLQGCAYALAHNEMFGTDIKKIVILMVDRESNFKEFSINADEFDKYSKKWAERLADYYAKHMV